MTPMPKVADVLDYLRARGWTMTGHWRGATVWSLGEFDVLVPPTDAMVDTPGRLRELVNCLADSEGRTPRLVRRDIALPAVDIVSYRARVSEEPITLPAGVRSLRAAQELVSTSVREVVTGPAEDANALLEQSFVELSEEVFGIDIGLPYEQDKLEPLGRRTALHLLRGSTVVLEAVRVSGADAAVRVFRMGVSEPFCAALANLAGKDGKAPFELGFRWSRRAPLENAALEFPTGAGERIQSIGSRFEPPAMDGIGGTVGVVEGLIRRLSDDEHGERWRIGVQGVLRVDGTVVGRRRVVSVLLSSAENYDAALMAHRQGQEVRARGVLTSKREISTTADDGFTVITPT